MVEDEGESVGFHRIGGLLMEVVVVGFGYLVVVLKEKKVLMVVKRW